MYSKIGFMLHMPESYTEHFTIFADLLGFREAMASADDARRSQILTLLSELSRFQGDFSLETFPAAAGSTGKTVQVRPAITTFSDHIVISFPLDRIRSEFDERMTAMSVLSWATRLLARLSAGALRLGFLLRGGATIGKLHHAQNIVFGEAMIEAYDLEARTAVYPRVVLSSTITSRPDWMATRVFVARDDDGIWRFDLFLQTAWNVASPGEKWAEQVTAWFHEIGPVMERSLKELEAKGRLNAFAKWAWFIHHFRQSLQANPEALKAWGDPLSGLPELFVGRAISMDSSRDDLGHAG
jgi:hypothetical protein